MTNKEDSTVVVFRMMQGEVFALFPAISHSASQCMSYAHVGQHSGADYHACIANSVPAKPEEYKALYNELTNTIGYNLIVRKRYTRKRA